MQRNRPPPNLLSLPTELRLRIYELAFYTDTKPTSETVNLIKRKGPNSALLCTCRQVYEEALTAYRVALPDFWSNTSFLIDSWKDEPTKQDIEKFTDVEIALITHLTIRNGSETFWYLHGAWEYLGPWARETRHPPQVLTISRIFFVKPLDWLPQDQKDRVMRYYRADKLRIRQFFAPFREPSFATLEVLKPGNHVSALEGMIGRGYLKKWELACVIALCTGKWG